MEQVTQILAKIEGDDPRAAEELLPLVYEELRQLALARLKQESPGQTLQPTALVHDAYLRLVDGHNQPDWNGRRHFFAAAAEAMRRILIERARHKQTQKRGGGQPHASLENDSVEFIDRHEQLLAVHEALNQLEEHDPQAAQLVKLRFFSGFGHQEAAEILGLGRRQADRLWAISRAWLSATLKET